MGVTSLQVSSLALGMSALALLIISNLTDCWRSDAKDPHSSVGLSWRCRGLWGECIYDITAAYWTCDMPNSVLGHLPTDVVITRVLVIVPGVACIVAVLFLVGGMKCTKFVPDGGTEKDKLSLCAGAILSFGGIVGSIGMTWYAAETIVKYRFEVSFGVPGITYELAYSYWLASTGVLCMCLAGVLLVSMHCPKINRSSEGKKRNPTFRFLTDQSKHASPASLPDIGKTYV
ncbi:claudin-16-like [Chiloscyllium plagiosum]|uniref:claudin-16-like n=1 Tax=Chiloscyllium plagiosum TaxID=36176 RepID=UPI001CB827FB|nr:claudin-16-like [Chiloscyllium plagiosum]XP_043531371.1 claudin-16-like [Chiloscyllium plagiosum]